MVLYRYLKELLEVNMKFTPELDAKIEEYKKLNPAFKFVQYKEEGFSCYRWKVFTKDNEGEHGHLIKVLNEDETMHLLKNYGIDTTGEPYFEINNPYPSGKTKLGFFFGRHGDALQVVRDGYAHVFSIHKAVFSNEGYADALYFLNTELGEKLRQATIEGFKNAVFKYTVDLNLNYGFGTCYHLGPNNKAYHSTWCADKKPMMFETEEEAQKVVDEMEAYIKEKVESFKTKDEFVEYLKERYHERIMDFPITDHAIQAEIQLKFRREENDHRTIAHYFEINQRLDGDEEEG